MAVKLPFLGCQDQRRPGQGLGLLKVFVGYGQQNRQVRAGPGKFRLQAHGPAQRRLRCLQSARCHMDNANLPPGKGQGSLLQIPGQRLHLGHIRTIVLQLHSPDQQRQFPIAQAGSGGLGTVQVEKVGQIPLAAGAVEAVDQGGRTEPANVFQPSALVFSHQGRQRRGRQHSGLLLFLLRRAPGISTQKLPKPCAAPAVGPGEAGGEAKLLGGGQAAHAGVEGFQVAVFAAKVEHRGQFAAQQRIAGHQPQTVMGQGTAQGGLQPDPGQGKTILGVAQGIAGGLSGGDVGDGPFVQLVAAVEQF